MKFDSEFVGIQAVEAEDLAYAGSRYEEVRDALFRNSYYLHWGAAGEPPLPVYEVALRRVLRGALRQWGFRLAAERAVDAPSDLRWGGDGRGYRRLLHPNAVCLFGKWSIDEPTEYTGYFQQGSRALLIARYSTCCTECRRGHYRSLSLVGKLFPTGDTAHPEPLKTANFITQEDIGGAYTPYINDALLRNAPDTTPWRRGSALLTLLATGVAFRLADRRPTIRQLYPIAELGKPAHVETNAPAFMQLRMAPDQPRIEGEALDFRDEVLGQIYDPGDPEPKRTLRFIVEVADVGSTHGVVRQRRYFPDGWRPIGNIEFTEAVASYNGDFVLHFHHPPWRRDANDPASAVRARF